MNLYRMEFEDLDGHTIVEYEMAGSPTEALELALGRQGLNVSIKKMPLHSSQAELLDQAVEENRRATRSSRF